MMDWKERLNTLRCSLDSPADEEEENSEAEKFKKDIQKIPLTVVTDKKGRKGKTAVIIEGFTIPQADVEEIAKQLKNKLGCGGSIREGEILIQGDMKDKVVEFLKNKNFKIK